MTLALTQATLDVADRNLNALVQIREAIKSCLVIDEVTEIRARAEAVRAWAKVHGRTKELRLDLLRIEVEALVRIVELGGAQTLGNGQRAAEWLAAMPPEAREQLIAASGGATTAVGMCRSIWREDEIKRARNALYDAGVRLAYEPEPPASAYSEEAIEEARARTHDVA